MRELLKLAALLLLRRNMARKRDKFTTIHVIEKGLKEHIIEWSATLLSIFGAILNVFKQIEGFYVWTVASLLWIWFAWKHKHYGLLLLSFVYLVIDIAGIISWAQS
jgi:nicotinamide riboside transporter PnuC